MYGADFVMSVVSLTFCSLGYICSRCLLNVQNIIDIVKVKLNDLANFFFCYFGGVTELFLLHTSLKTNLLVGAQFVPIVMPTVC